MSSLTKRLALHGLLDPPRERRPHPGDLRELVHGGLTDAADAPEAAQQGALARRTDAVAVVDRPLEPPAQRVAHVGEVVVAVADLRAEPAVRVLRRAPVLENDHRAHHARALHVAHVVALDPLRRAVEPERLRELAERGVGLATVGEPTDPLLRERVLGVTRRELREVALLA